MPPDLVCAIDVGTSGVKAAAISIDGATLAGSSHSYGITRSSGGHVEQSPAELERATLEVVREVTAAVGASRIACLAVSSQRASFAALDGNCKPLTPIISWQDHRATAQCTALRESIGDTAYYRLTGLAIAPTAAISKIMWLRDAQPEVFRRAAWFVSHQALALLGLGADTVCCSRSDASYIGLLDVNSLAWSDELCALADVVPERLGAVTDSGQLVGVVSPTVAATTGLATSTPLVLGGGDLQCGALGVGVIDPGAISIGVGTGGHCVAATTEPFLHPGLATSCQAHVVPARWEVEGIALATSATFQWLAEQLGAPDTDSANGGDRSRYDDIITESLHVPPGADGLLVLPTLNGAGTPHWKPNVRGAVLGLSSSHTRATLYRAFLEGICYEMRGVLNAVCELGIEATDLRVWGGPARSAAWVQMFSNVLGRPLTVSTEADAGLVGAGILGAVGVGLRSTIESAVGSMVKAGHLTEPDPDHAAIYDHGYERYLDALDLVMSHNS